MERRTHHEPVDSEASGDVFSTALRDADDERMDHADLAMLAEVKASVLETEPEEVRIGRFQVLRVLGSGGMGKVYEAEDPSLGRRVAIKLHKELVATPEQHERMHREARMLAQLVHDNVVRVYEVGEHQRRVYVVMELVAGRTLQELQQVGPLPWRRAVELYAMAGRGLQAAHDEEIVHRDFKPANVIVDANGRSKVLDFGVARELSSDGVEETTNVLTEEPGAIERAPGHVLTNTGMLLGTPAYMAPELLGGKAATPQSDQFSFCVALYEAIHGRRPFTGKSPFALLSSMQSEPPLALEGGPKVPPWLLAVLRRGLSLDPRERYPSMTELLADLERNRAGRWRWVALPLAFSAGVGALALALVVPSAELAAVGEHPEVAGGSAHAVECLDVASRLRERWTAVREGVHTEDELEDVRGVIDSAVARFAEQLGSSCLEADARYQGCHAQAERDFAALLAGASQHARLPASSFSGLAHDLALCLEDEPSGTCEPPLDDGGSAAALSEAKGALALGRPGDAEVLGEQALALAQRKGDRLGEVRARSLLGEIHDQLEQVPQARQALDAAIATASQCGAVVPTIDAALERVEVELHHRAQGRADLTALPLALAREYLDAEAPESLGMRRAALEEKQAGVSFSLELRCAGAIESYRSVLARREEALAELQRRGRPAGPLLRLRADAELDLANAALDCGAEGASAVIELLETARRHLDEAHDGHEHPDRAVFDFGLGRALARYGRHAEAERHYRGALATYAKFGAAGEAGANVGDVHLALVQTLRRQGRLDEAQAHAVANVEIRREHAGARSALAMAEALGAVGAVAAEREDYEQARRYHQEAVDGLVRESTTRELDGRERMQLAGSYANVALALCGLEQPVQSSEAFEKAQKWQLTHDQLTGVGDVLEAHECPPKRP